MSLVRPLLLSLLFSAPASLSAPDIHMVAAPHAGPMRNTNGLAVAFAEERGLAVWLHGAHSIWGVPLDEDGRQLAPARELVLEEATVGLPSVRWIRDSFILWWSTAWPLSSRFARLDANANVLEVGTVPIHTGAPIAWNSDVILTKAGSSIEFLNHEFEPVQSFQLSDPQLIYETTGVVFDDGSFALVTSGWNGVFVHRFSRDGDLVGGPLLIEASTGTTATAYRPLRVAAATDGTSVLVAWTASSSRQLPDLKTAIVHADHSVSNQQTVVSNRWRHINNPHAAWDGQAYTVVFSSGDDAGFAPQDDFQIMGLQLDRSGAVLAPMDLLVDRPGHEMQLEYARSRSRGLLFFKEGDQGFERILVAALEPQSIARADRGEAAVISLAPASQVMMQVASGGDEWLAVWVEQTTDSDMIRTVPLQRDGRPAGTPSTIRTFPRWIGAPAVSFNGIDYVVSWFEGPALVAKRVRRDGTAIDETPIVVTTGQSAIHGSPAMASNPGVTLLAWTESERIFTAALRADGTVTTPEPVSDVPPTPNIGYFGPFLAADGDRFFAAWSRGERTPCVGVPCPFSVSTEYRLLDSGGRPLLLRFAVPQAEIVSMAGSRSGYLLVFRSYQSIDARIIDRHSGAASAAIGIAISRGDAMRAAAFGADDQFLVVYQTGAGLFRRALTAGGDPSPAEAMKAFTMPLAMNASGNLLAYGPRHVPEPPYLGRHGLATQLIDQFFSNPPARRRSAGR